MSDTNETEKKAMAGDKMAVLRVIGALRQYRAASKNLLDRYDEVTSNSELASAVARFEIDVDNIESELE